MAQESITQTGVFTGESAEKVNHNFDELYAAPAAVDAIEGPASAVAGNIVAFDGTTGKLAEDSGVAAADVVVGPASVTAGKVAIFDGTTGKLVEADAAGATAGPFTTITAIEVVNGLVVTLTGT